MEHKPPRPMTPFDDLVTPPYLYTLKLLLPYTPSSNQRFLAIYIKFLELRFTLESFHGFSSCNRSLHGQNASAPFGMFEEIKPYMAPEEKEQMEQMETMMNMMELFQSMQAVQGEAGEGGNFNPMDMMMGMLSPEQQEMFQMYNNMFDSDMKAAYTTNNESSNQKGDSKHE